jgi:hypothetical protein
MHPVGGNAYNNLDAITCKNDTFSENTSRIMRV